MKKFYFVLLMNVFTNFTNNITKEVNRLESNINNTIDNVKVTLETPGQELDAILSDLRNGVEVRGISPDSIDGLSDTEAKKYILQKLQDIDSDLPPFKKPVIKMEQKEPNIEETQEILEDPQIASIFDDLRSEFPEPTNTPEPLITGRLRTREPTPNVKIENFEDIPLSTAARVNKHLEQQFIENFKF